MAIAVPSTEVNSPTLKQRLARAERLNRWKAQALIAPLVLFLLLVFLVPIVALLYKSVGNPEVVGGLPRTVVAVSRLLRVFRYCSARGLWNPVRLDCLLHLFWLAVRTRR